MTKYITCITRVFLNARRILMSSCPGEPSLYDTHCQYCDYWAENQPEPEEDEDDDFSEQQSCPSDHWSERENLSKQGDNEDDEEETE